MNTTGQPEQARLEHPHGRRGLWLVLLLGLLAALCLVLLIQPFRAPRAGNEAVATAPPADGAALPVDRPRDEERHESYPSNLPTQTATNSNTNADDASLAPPNPVRIVDRDGKPLADFPVRVSVFPSGDLRRRAESFGAQRDIGGMLEAAGNTSEQLTRADGTLLIAVPRYTNDSAVLLVAASDWKSWLLSSDHFGSAAAVFPGACIVHVESRPRRLDIVATRVMHTVVPISFADGQSFSGNVRITLYTGGANASPAVDTVLPLRNVLTLTIDHIDGVRRGTITCVSNRLGFAARHAVDVNDATLQGLTGIVIPAVPAEAQCGLVVDLTGLHAEDGWKFQLRVGFTEQHIGIVEWGKEFRTLQLAAGRAYTARIEGKDGRVWESEPVSAVPGEVTRLVPQIEQPCRVQLRVLSDQGELLFPAFATLAEHVVPRWELTEKNPAGFGRPQQGFAYGGQSGVIVLEAIPATSKTLYVEAKGFERISLPLALVAGKPLDLGDVRLGAATGSITVELVGFVSSKNLVAVLRGASGGVVAEKTVSSASSTVRFDALPFREYTVLVGTKSGNLTETLDGTPKPLRLTAATPNAEVVFDQNNPHLRLPGRASEQK